MKRRMGVVARMCGCSSPSGLIFAPTAFGEASGIPKSVSAAHLRQGGSFVPFPRTSFLVKLIRSYTCCSHSSDVPKKLDKRSHVDGFEMTK